MGLPGIVFFVAIGIGVIAAVYQAVNRSAPQICNTLPPRPPPLRIRRRRRLPSHENNAICTICLEENGATVKLSCGHWFHFICLKKLNEAGHNRCPNCRDPFIL